MLGSGTLSVEVSLYGGGSSPVANPANQDILYWYGANRSQLLIVILGVLSSSRAENNYCRVSSKGCIQYIEINYSEMGSAVTALLVKSGPKYCDIKDMLKRKNAK